jgi:hypothetical protein
VTTTLPLSATSEAPPRRAEAISDCLSALGLPDRRLTPDELERAALAVAGRPDLWEDLVVDSPDQRWWIVLHRTDAYEVRLLSWEFDQTSGWHDHGGSSGGFVVTSGVLEELSRGADFCSVEHRHFGEGAHGSFGPEHVHDVSHAAGRPAVSVHAYSPPLTQLTMYEPTPYGFVVREVVPDDRRES